VVVIEYIKRVRPVYKVLRSLDIPRTCFNRPIINLRGLNANRVTLHYTLLLIYRGEAIKEAQAWL